MRILVFAIFDLTFFIAGKFQKKKFGNLLLLGSSLGLSLVSSSSSIPPRMLGWPCSDKEVAFSWLADGRELLSENFRRAITSSAI